MSITEMSPSKEDRPSTAMIVCNEYLGEVLVWTKDISFEDSITVSAPLARRTKERNEDIWYSTRAFGENQVLGDQRSRIVFRNRASDQALAGLELWSKLLPNGTELTICRSMSAR